MPDTQNTEMTREQLEQRIRELEGKVTLATSKDPYMAVSEKGAISFYNLGQRFPITGYVGQVMAILTLCTGYDRAAIESSDWPIVEFIHENDAKLSKTNGREAAQVQNTVQTARNEALKAVYDVIKKANPKMSVAEVEAEAKRKLGWT